MEELYPQMSARQAIAIVRKRNEVAGVAEESVAAGVTGAGVTGAGLTGTRLIQGSPSESDVVQSSESPSVLAFLPSVKYDGASIPVSMLQLLQMPRNSGTYADECGHMLTNADVC
jgi:hypothetical protein